MQTTGVTQAQWKALKGKNPASHKRCGDTFPVEQVSWEDAQGFIYCAKFETDNRQRRDK
jgi:formylglycine-generating enzyme required for sulfatase activity